MNQKSGFEIWPKCLCGMEKSEHTHPSIFLYLSGFSKILVSLPTLVKHITYKYLIYGGLFIIIFAHFLIL